MARKRFNWQLLVVVLVGLVVLAAAAFGVRRWQRSSRASEGLRLGNLAFEEGRWQEAASELGKHLAVVPDDVEILLKYAAAQRRIRPFKQQNAAQARQAYRNVLQIDSTNTEAALQAVQFHRQLGAPGEAVLIARRLLEQVDSVEVRRELAAALIQQREYTAADVELRQIIDAHPDDVAAYDLLITSIVRQTDDKQQPGAKPDDVRKAVGDTIEPLVEQAVSTNPTSAEAYLGRARFWLIYRRDPDKCRADLEQAQSLDLSDTAVKMRLARLWFAVDETDKARQLFEEVRAVDQTDPALWDNLIAAALRSDADAEVVRENVVATVEQALVALPSTQRWDYLPNAIELFLRYKKLDRAEQCVEEIRSYDVMHSYVALWQGLIARERGDDREAVEQLSKALQLFEQAKRGSEERPAVDPSPRIRMNLADVLARSGDNLSAIKHLRAVAAEYPGFLPARLGLARLLSEIGAYDEAEQQARVARAIAPTSEEAANLFLRAQMMRLGSEQTPPDAQAWQVIEEQLRSMEEATEGAVDLPMVQFNLALQRNDMPRAAELLKTMQENEPEDLPVAMAQVRLLLAQDDKESARQKLQELTTTFPDAVDPIVYLAGLYNSDEDREACEQLLGTALDRFERPADRRVLTLLLADLYRSWEDTDKSQQLLTRAAAEMPDDITVRRRLLSLPQVAENVAVAQPIIDQIKETEGEDGWRWRYEQARLWLRPDFQPDQGEDSDENANRDQDSQPDQGTTLPPNPNRDQAISLLKENLIANPADLASTMLLVGIYDRIGEAQLAAATCREALGYAPDNVNLMMVSVKALNKIGADDEVDEILARLSQHRVSDPELARLQYGSRLRHGRFSEGEDILRDLISKNPEELSNKLVLVELLMRQEKYDDAASLLDTLQQEHPDNLAVITTQIDMRLFQKKPDEALKICDDVVERFADKPSSYLMRARTCLTLGRTAQAEADLLRAIELAPDNVGIRVRLYDFYRDQGRTAEAVAAVKEALKLAPDNPQVIKRATGTFIDSGDEALIATGKSMLDEALKSFPNDVDLRFQKASLLLLEQTSAAREEAKAMLGDVVSDEPQATRAWVQLVKLAYQEGRYREAMDLAFEALAHAPRHRELLLLKAQAEFSVAPVLAISTLKTLREYYPDDVPAVLLLANAYGETEQANEAVALLEEALSSAQEADQPVLKMGLMAAKYRSGKKAEAMAALDQMQQANPDDPRPMLTQTNLLVGAKQWAQTANKVDVWLSKHPEDVGVPMAVVDQLLLREDIDEDIDARRLAVKLLRPVVARDPGNATATMRLAVVLQTLGETDEAIELYERHLRDHPDDVRAINNLAWLLCEEQKDYQRALELAQRGLAIWPEYLDLVDTRGVVFYRLNQLNKAIADFEMCIKRYPSGSPGLAGSCFHLGRAQAKLGNTSEAIINLKRADEINAKLKYGGLTAADLAEMKKLTEELVRGN